MEYWNLNWGKRTAKIRPNRLIETKQIFLWLDKLGSNCKSLEVFSEKATLTGYAAKRCINSTLERGRESPERGKENPKKGKKGKIKVS